MRLGRILIRKVLCLELMEMSNMSYATKSEIILLLSIIHDCIIYCDIYTRLLIQKVRVRLKSLNC